MVKDVDELWYIRINKYKNNSHFGCISWSDPVSVIPRPPSHITVQYILQTKCFHLDSPPQNINCTLTQLQLSNSAATSRFQRRNHEKHGFHKFIGACCQNQYFKKSNCDPTSTTEATCNISTYFLKIFNRVVEFINFCR